MCFYAIDGPLGRNTTQDTFSIGRERTKCTDIHLDSNKLVNVRRYIIKSNSLKDAEKDIILKNWLLLISNKMEV